MKRGAGADERSPLLFIALVFVLSVPLWLVGARYRTELLPGLPLSARVRDKVWYIPIVLLQPVVALLTYGVMRVPLVQAGRASDWIDGGRSVP